MLNLAYFGVEFTVAATTGSVSLFADSIDFLEDASVNILIAFVLRWSATSRARLGMALAGILLIPGPATLWTAWEKLMAPMPPAPLPPVADRSGCPGDQLIVCIHAGTLPGAQWQSDAGSVPLGSQRYGSEPRDHRGRVCYCLHALGLAGFARWARNRRDLRRCRTRRLESGSNGTQGCGGVKSAQKRLACS